MAAKRFPIRIDAVWGPLLLLIGTTPENSYVEVDAKTLRMRFGWLFSKEIERSNVERAAPAAWRWWRGIGLRILPGGPLGLIGSYSGVVELHLREPLGWGLLRFSRVAVSLLEPEAFVKATTARPRARRAAART